MEEKVIVSCILRNDYGDILLIHNYVSERTNWDLPNDSQQEDESLEDAAVRIARQVIGVRVQPGRQLASFTYQDDDDNVLRYYWIEGRLVEGAPHITEPDLYDDCEYFAIEDFPSLSLSLGAYTLSEEVYSGSLDLD